MADPDSNGVGTVINDPDPAYDDCSDSNHTSTNNLAAMTGRNVGDLLDERGVSGGWFQGGFAPTVTYAGSGSYAVCGATHQNIGAASSADYSPHHNPFEYYASTANPHQVAPKNLAEVGHDGPANHQYDLTWFTKAAKRGSMPAVSFLKPSEYQDGHAGYSDPIDEQHFLVKTINMLQKSKDWKSTAVVVAYDDSDGWYDHAATEDHELVGHGERRRDLLVVDGAGPGRLPRSLRPWSATAVADDLAVREDQLRRSPPQRAGLDHQVHRGQLVHRPDRRRVLRQACRHARRLVRLHPVEQQAGAAQAPTAP